MNISTLTILLLMLFVFALAEISSFVFKIRTNIYYSFFHFVGGGLTYLFLLSIINNNIVSLIGVLVVGILWEIHEWILWKYILKKKRYKPEKKDTLNDIVLDIFGGLTVYFLIFFFNNIFLIPKN